MNEKPTTIIPTLRRQKSEASLSYRANARTSCHKERKKKKEYRVEWCSPEYRKSGDGEMRVIGLRNVI